MVVGWSAVMPTAVPQRYNKEGECSDFPGSFLFIVARMRRIDLIVMAHLYVWSVRTAVGARGYTT